MRKMNLPRGGGGKKTEGEALLQSSKAQDTQNGKAQDTKLHGTGHRAQGTGHGKKGDFGAECLAVWGKWLIFAA